MKRTFTLIEVLLAIVISLIIIGVLYQSFDLSLDIFTKIQYQANNDVCDFFNNLKRDISSVYVLNSESKIYFKGSTSSLEFFTITPLQSIALTDEFTDLAKVSMARLVDKRSQSVLSYKRSLLNPVDFETASRPLRDFSINGVESLQFRYFKKGAWQNVWISRDALPEAIEVTLALKGFKRRKAVTEYKTIISIPCGM